jgi:hypothetical protein
MDMKKAGIKGVDDKIQSVFGGAMEYMDAAALGQDLSDLKYIEDTLPEGTRRLQVKSHIPVGDKRYLLVSCAGGKQVCVIWSCQCDFFSH